MPSTRRLAATDAYINHSCSRTLHAHRAGRRVMFFALRDIEVGEEITIDYRNGRTRGGGLRVRHGALPARA